MTRYHILARLIQYSVPVLNIFRSPPVWPYPLADLANLEEGTLGKALHTFLTERNLGYLPQYEEHDTYHALLGYGTSVTEELKLQAFMWGNKNATFAGKILFILGYIIFPSQHGLFKNEIKRGQLAMPLSNVNIASMIPQKLAVLRRELCIS